MNGMANTNRRVKFLCAALAGVLALAAGTTQANTYTWNPGGTSPLTEGSGTWSTSTATWWYNSAPLNWVDNNTAQFGGLSYGTAGTVTIPGTVAPYNIIFNQPNSGNYTRHGHFLRFLAATSRAARPAERLPATIAILHNRGATVKHIFRK